jgi:hypothetical protein
MTSKKKTLQVKTVKTLPTNLKVKTSIKVGARTRP